MNLVCEKLSERQILFFIALLRRCGTDGFVGPGDCLLLDLHCPPTLSFDEILLAAECFFDHAENPVYDTDSGAKYAVLEKLAQDDKSWRVKKLPQELVGWMVERWPQVQTEPPSITILERAIRSTVVRVGFANFKAYGERTQLAPIRPITLLFGKNSSGKSSFLQGLLLLNHAAQEANLDVHEPLLGKGVVDLGGFGNILRDHDVFKDLRLRCDLRLSLPGDKGYDFHEKQILEASLVVDYGYPASVEVASSIDDPRVLEQLLDDLGTLDGPPSPKKATIEVGKDWLMEIRYLGLDDYSEGWEGEFFGWVIHQVNLKHPFLVSVFKEVVDQAGLGDSTPEDMEFLTRAAQVFLRPDSDEGISERAMLNDDLVMPRGLMSHLGQLENWFWHKPDRSFLPDDLPLEPRIPFESGTRQEQLANAINVNAFRRLVVVIDSILDAAQDWIGHLDYVGPTRGHPDSRLESRHLRPYPLRPFYGQSTPWELVAREEHIRDQVNHWLKRRFKMPYEVALQMYSPWKLINGDSANSLVREVSRSLHKLLVGESEHSVGDSVLSGSDGLTDPDVVLETMRSWFRQWASRRYLQSRIQQKLVLVDSVTGVEHLTTDLGYGVSQVLPVTVTSLAQRETTVLIEQPELHLHPAMQCELGDLFIEAAMGGSKNRFILETHSEHLILRLLRRIRETTNGTLPEGAHPITPEDVAVVYAEPTEEGTILHEMKITDDGDFEEDWPEGFFEERLDELF